MEFSYSRREALCAGGLVLAGGLAGCSGDGGDDGDNVVDMTDDLVFEPETLTVPVGTTVTWENVGSIGHSVTAYEEDIPDGADYFASGGFDSEDAARNAYPSEGDIPGGESYEHTFEVAGTYEYFCIPHEASGMVGTIEVEE
jgi:plastocyanin